MILMNMLGTDLNIWNFRSNLSYQIDKYLKNLKEENEFKRFYNRLWDTDYPHTLGKQLDLAKLQPIVPMGKIGRDI
ncbi:BgTH12-00950 [Blumeria graminis f. sp. triticale]|uniref:BgTH12-00950 n=1 Tax=Blumeria graminis f. sp. triticale TaxID=1689686 RepID=A0A9W4D7H3_BLUGR|nr:BgTH12-00950 [Blumeria graminis f. sp. triticale]